MGIILQVLRRFQSLLCFSRDLHNWPMIKPPDSKVHGVNMGPTWVPSSPDGPHVGPINLAIRASSLLEYNTYIANRFSFKNKISRSFRI